MPARPTSRLLARASAFARAAAAALAAVAAPYAGATDALVVRSSDAQPYQQASDAAMERLRSAGVAAKEALASDIGGESAAVELGAGVLIAIGTEAAILLRERAPSEATIVYCLVADPARAGLLGRANVHGVSTETPLEAQFDLMARVAPRARSVGALYRSSDPSTIETVERLRGAAPRSWRVEAVDLDAFGSIAEAIDAVFARGVDFFWTSPERSIYDQATIRQVLLTSLRRKTPVFGFSEAFVRAGALVGMSVDPSDQGRHAAAIALEKSALGGGRGEAPPTGEPTHDKAIPRVSLNRVVAEQLGMTLPAGAIADADKVYGD